MVIAIPVAVAAALVAFLLMGGALLLSKFLGNLFRNIPAVGPTIASGIESAVSWAVNTTWGLLSAAIGGMLHFVEAPFHFMWQFGDAVVAGFERTAGALASLAATLAQAFDHAVAYAQAAADAVSAALQQTAGAIEAALGAATTSLTAYADRLYSDALSALATTATALEGAIAATWRATTTAIAQTQAWVQGLVSDATTAVEHDLSAVAGTVVGDVEQLGRWATTAVHDVLDSLTGTIDQARAESMAYTEAVAASITGYLATTLAPAVTAVATEVDDCVRPYCGGLQGLGNDLNQLATALAMLALLGLLVEAVADPGALVTEITDVVTPLADAVGELFKAAVGLGA
jgi:hypothetical protein